MKLLLGLLSLMQIIPLVAVFLQFFGTELDEEFMRFSHKNKYVSSYITIMLIQIFGLLIFGLLILGLLILGCSLIGSNFLNK